jgi:hypothetical protein
MTDKQIRDRIVGALSASMMPMEMEAECVAFLDRCLDQISWHPAEQLPVMHTEVCDLDMDPFEFEISESLLAFTVDWEMVTVNCSKEAGMIYWTDLNGSEYEVLYWKYIPQVPEVLDND